MSDLELRVMLSQNRDESGIMQVIDFKNNSILAQYEALGRGSQGGGNTQMITNGNTPIGTYSVMKIKQTAHLNQSSYGPNGALELKPTDGVALAVSRPGILVHGGDSSSPGYFRRKQGSLLRATHGCIRLSNDDMKSLAEALFTATLNDDAKVCEFTSIKLNVTDYPASFSRP